MLPYRPTRFRSVWLVFAILMVSGCAQTLPQQELRNYQDAIEQTQAAATQVLRIYADDVKENRANEIKTATQPQTFERTFVLEQVLKSQGEVDALGSRLIALQTITRYTDLLVTLAEGKSVEQLQKSSGLLVASLETVGGFFSFAPVPGLQLATPLLKTVIGALEAARTREQFRAAVEKGEPIIVKILSFLEEETPLYYGLAITLFDVKNGVIIREVSNAVRDIIGIVASHQAPEDPEVLKNIQDELDKTLRSMAHEFEVVNLTPGDDTPFTIVAKSQIRRLMEDVTAGADKEKKLVADLNAYYQLLKTYVLLLNQTKKGLQNLRAALDQPRDVQADFENILLLALRVRQKVEDLRSSL